MTTTTKTKDSQGHRPHHCSFSRLNSAGRCIAGCYYNNNNLVSPSDCTGNTGKHDTSLSQEVKLNSIGARGAPESISITDLPAQMTTVNWPKRRYKMLNKQMRVTVYFGREIQQQHENESQHISHEEFKDFLRAYVDPHFSGYTLIDAVGMWEGVSEATTVLILLVPECYYNHIENMANEYCKCFSQDSVLVECQEVVADFIGGGGYDNNDNK